MRARRLSLSALTALVAAVLAAMPVRAAEPKKAPWWNEAWKLRKVVRVKFPQQGNDIPVTFFESSRLLGERSLTARAAITVESGIERLSKEIVVTDAGGNVVPAHSYAKGREGLATVIFKAPAASVVYYIYYGNPGAERERINWRRSAYPILMATAPVSGPDDIETAAKAARAFLAAKELVGKTETYSLRYAVNPFGLKGPGHYITLYSGLLDAPAAGTYEFAVDVGGTAHLLIDGSLVQTVRGGSRPARTWRKTAPVKLTKGEHNFTILHGERAAAQGIRVGWRRPADRRVSLMAGSAFRGGNYISVEVIGLEELGRAVVPFFTLERSDVAFEAPGGKAMVALKLNNLTAGEGLDYRWQLGEMSLTERSPRCFVEAGTQYRITLDVARAGQRIGSYERTESFRVIRRVRAEVTFELLRCPNVIYEAERAKLTFKMSNPSEYPIPLRLDCSAGKGSSVCTDIVVDAGGEHLADLALPTPSADGSSVVASFCLRMAGAELGQETIRIVRPGSHLADLTPKLGHLVDGEGRRVVIATRLEDQNEHQRWAVLKWAAKQLKASPQNILFFGDPMLNGKAPEAKGYVDVLKRRVVADDRTFTFVSSSAEAIVPCVADIPAFTAALGKHTPDLVVISPGSRDAVKGVTRRQLARSLDLFIDLARAQKNPPDVVLVSPPPLVSNLRLSERFADTVRIIAEQHRVPFVNLHSLVTARKDWKASYKQDADDDVYYRYPNDETQKGFADVILDAIE